MDFRTFSFILLVVFVSGSKALNCTTCPDDGSPCRGSIKCRNDPRAVCGMIDYKVNGTSRVASGCTLKEQCVGTVDCYKDGFEFGKGKVGYSDCIVTCCTTDNCTPKPPLKCNKCEAKGDAVCADNSVSCGTDQDRCARVNFKLNGTATVYQGCHTSASCANDTLTCGLVKHAHPNDMITECKPYCCKGDNCNKKIPDGAASLVFSLPLLAAALLHTLFYH